MKITINLKDESEPTPEMQRWLDSTGELFTDIMSDPLFKKVNSIMGTTGELEEELSNCASLEELIVFMGKWQ